MTKGLFWLQLKNGYNFQFASKELQNDKDIVIAAVKQNIEFITYASNNMQNDFDVFKNWFIYLRGLANLIIKDYIIILIIIIIYSLLFVIIAINLILKLTLVII